MKNTPDSLTTGRIGGFAPGTYTCRCLACSATFVGEKRAMECERCALGRVSEATVKELARLYDELALAREALRHCGCVDCARYLEEADQRAEDVQ